jgi:site-specific DNA-methyltransferase (adenine-specific)
MDKERIHTTQKPIKLYRWLLQNYAEEGDRILDTHGGSMSLAIACWEEGFELDIIELDEDYYEAALDRFKEHIKQGRLFEASPKQEAEQIKAGLN